MTAKPRQLIFAVSALFIAGAMTSGLSQAMDSDPPPKPKIDCKKPENKNKPKCKKKKNQAALSDDQLYYTGYWLARAGKYAEARRYFLQASNQNNPRILNYLGFTTRKLGDVKAALPYYRKALKINPNFNAARAYLGEAYLQLNKPDAAQKELAEIEKRCGRTCREYAELAGHLEKFKNRQPRPEKHG